MSQKLTATVIKNLKPRAARYLVTDSHTPGLVLKVSAKRQQILLLSIPPLRQQP